MGEYSNLATAINSLAELYSTEFGRQSDRTMPATSFSKGIKVGKLMATEYRGVLLIMLAILRSTSGRVLIVGKKKNFKTAEIIDDWILLVELMLQWEAYLNEKEMSKEHVIKLEKKHRYLMYIMKKVAKRTEGMGLNIMKFHAIIHAVGDIKLNGVPTEYDTAANESHHKPAKHAAKLTQMAANTFQFQTATRLVEFILVSLAMAEIENGPKLWEYLDEYEEADPVEADPVPEMEVPDPKEPTLGPKITTGGTKIEVFEDKKGIASFQMRTRSKFAKETRWNQELVDFLWALEVKVSERLPNFSLPINTCHKRDDQIFRGHPNFRGRGPWKDWAWVNWGGEGRLPCHIWCFVTLNDLPTGGGRIDHGGIQLKNSVYAVVECTTLETDKVELGRSDLMMPIVKDGVLFDDAGFVTKRTFFLADTQAFHGPCCVIPDIGGPKNRYFVVKPRSEWAGDFTQWLMDPHHLDQMDPIPSDEQDEEVNKDDEEVDEDFDPKKAKITPKGGKKRKPMKKT